MDRKEQVREQAQISGYLDLGLDTNGKQVVVCWPNVISLEVWKKGTQNVPETKVTITFAAGPKMDVLGDQAERFLITIGLWEAEKKESPIIQPNDDQLRMTQASRNGKR